MHERGPAPCDERAVSDTELIEWIDSHDCVELILKSDASEGSKRSVFFGSLMGDFGSAISIREALGNPCRDLVTDDNPPITRITLWAVGIIATDEQAEQLNKLASFKVAKERDRCAKIAESVISDMSHVADQDAEYEIGIRNEAARGVADSIRKGLE